MSTLRAALAAAALAAVAVAAQAQTSVTLYGIADGGFSHVIGQDAAKNRVVSGVMEGSRWGLRGNEDLGGGFRAVFTLENRFEVDTGELSNRPPSGTQLPERFTSATALGLTQAYQPVVTALGQRYAEDRLGVNLEGRYFDRQAFVGLVTPVGAVLMGRQYTPAYEVSATFETMHTESSLAFGQIAAFPPSLEIRTSDTLAYRIQLGDFTASAMYGFGEGSIDNGRMIAAMAMYKTPDWGVGAAYQTRENEFGDKALTNAVLGAYAALGPGTLWTEYINIKDDHPSGLQEGRDILLGLGFDSKVIVDPVIDAFSEALRQDANAYHVGYSLNRGPHTLSVAFSYFDDRRPLDADVASYGAVYTYAFSKRTDVSFVLTRFDNSDTAQVAPGQAGFYGGFASEPGEDVLSTAIGIRHRF